MAMANFELPHDFVAPAYSKWFEQTSKKMTEDEKAAARIAEADGLIRNACDVAHAMNSLYTNNDNLFTNDANPGYNLPCGVRLVKLLYYIHGVVDCFYNTGAELEPPNSRDSMAIYLQLLEVYLENAPPGWTPSTQFIDDPAAPQPGVPSEPMNELLGRLYIWVGQQQGVPLATADEITEYLRTIPMAFVKPRQSIDYRDAGQKLGFALCIFVTQPQPGQIIVGSTKPELPESVTGKFQEARASRITEYVKELLKLTNGQLRLQYSNAIKEHKESWERATLKDDKAKFEQAKKAYIAEMKKSEATYDFGKDVSPQKPTFNGQELLKQAPPYEELTNLGQTGVVLGKFRKKEATWMPIDRIASVARSHMFLPGSIPGRNRFFEPIPRCMKCRVIHDYRIDTELMDAMLEPAVCNLIPYCAEDLAHAKLRTFTGGTLVRVPITTDSSPTPFMPLPPGDYWAQYATN